MVAYVARLGELGRALGQVLERAQLAASEGVHAPRFAYDAVIQQTRALITGAPFGGTGDSPLFADAKAKLAALVAGGRSIRRAPTSCAVRQRRRSRSA